MAKHDYKEVLITHLALPVRCCVNSFTLVRGWLNWRRTHGWPDRIAEPAYGGTTNSYTMPSLLLISPVIRSLVNIAVFLIQRHDISYSFL